MKITKKKHFKSPVSKVWAAITEEEQLSQWFMQAKFKAEVGYTFEFQDEPRGKWDGRLWGDVTEVVAERKLSYTWIGNQMKRKTQVTWTLSPTPDNGTEVVLEHVGFKGFSDGLIGFFHLFGWKKYMQGLTHALGQ